MKMNVLNKNNCTFSTANEVVAGDDFWEKPEDLPVGNLRDKADELSNDSFRDVIEETQNAIFESFASLDDKELEECFGMSIDEALAKATRKEQEMLKEFQRAKDEAAAKPTNPISTSPTSVSDDEIEIVDCDVESRDIGAAAVSRKHGAEIVRQVSRDDEKQMKTKPANDPKPQRPSSAYNLFFQIERQRLIAGVTPDVPISFDVVKRVAAERRVLQQQIDKPKRKHRRTHGKISFAELARTIARRWKELSLGEKDLLKERAGLEKTRYLRELEEWTKRNGVHDGVAELSSTTVKEESDSDPSIFNSLQEAQSLVTTWRDGSSGDPWERDTTDYPCSNFANTFREDFTSSAAGTCRRETFSNMHSEGRLAGDDGPDPSCFHEMRGYSKRVRFNNMASVQCPVPDDNRNYHPGQSLYGMLGRSNPNQVMAMFGDLQVEDSCVNNTMKARMHLSFNGHSNTPFERYGPGMHQHHSFPLPGHPNYHSRQEPLINHRPTPSNRHDRPRPPITTINQQNGMFFPPQSHSRPDGSEEELQMSALLSEYEEEYRRFEC